MHECMQDEVRLLHIHPLKAREKQQKGLPRWDVKTILSFPVQSQGSIVNICVLNITHLMEYMEDTMKAV